MTGTERTLPADPDNDGCYSEIGCDRPEECGEYGRCLYAEKLNMSPALADLWGRWADGIMEQIGDE